MILCLAERKREEERNNADEEAEKTEDAQD